MAGPPSAWPTCWPPRISRHQWPQLVERVRLTLDLRLEPRADAGVDERLLTIGELGALVHDLRQLASLLCGQSWQSVDVLTDDALPLTGVQAGALGLAGLARARRFNG